MAGQEIESALEIKSDCPVSLCSYTDNPVLDKLTSRKLCQGSWSRPAGRLWVCTGALASSDLHAHVLTSFMSLEGLLRFFLV